jgi:hypothetical protein
MMARDLMAVAEMLGRLIRGQGRDGKSDMAIYAMQTTIDRFMPKPKG